MNIEHSHLTSGPLGVAHEEAKEDPVVDAALEVEGHRKWRASPDHKHKKREAEGVASKASEGLRQRGRGERSDVDPKSKEKREGVVIFLMRKRTGFQPPTAKKVVGWKKATGWNHP